MGASGSAPATAGSKGQGSGKMARKGVSAPIPAKQHHQSSPSQPLKKGPRNYVDMGIEEEGDDQFEQGEWLGKGLLPHLFWAGLSTLSSQWPCPRARPGP